MKRRNVLKGIAAGSAMSVGVAGASGPGFRDADVERLDATHVVRTTDRGEREKLTLEEFERRSDTPSLSALGDVTTDGCTMTCPDPCCDNCPTGCDTCLCCDCNGGNCCS